MPRSRARCRTRLQRVASQPIDPNAANDVSSAGFNALEATAGERFVAIGDVDGDGQRDIVVGTGAAERPEVRVFTSTGADSGPSFFAYNQAFLGGVRVASCDVTGDGAAEIITGAGPGGGPHVRVVACSSAGLVELGGFFAYARRISRAGCSWRAETSRATALPRSSRAPGAGGGPHVRVFQILGSGVTELASFFAYAPAFSGGVRVAAGDVTGDGVAEIVTGPGPGGGPHVRVFSLSGGLTEIAGFYAYDPHFARRGVGGGRRCRWGWPGRDRDGRRARAAGRMCGCSA